MPVRAMFPGKGSGNGFAALQLETARLHRENTRLRQESSRLNTESYSSLQVANTNLMRQVGRLQGEVVALKQEVERLRNGAELVSLREEVERLHAEEKASQAGPVEESPESIREEEPGDDVDIEEAEDEKPDEEPPWPVAHMPPFVPGRKHVEWMEHGGSTFESYLRGGSFALVDASWLVAWSSANDPPQPLPRRQDLPPEAFISLEDLKLVGCPHGALPIIAISCPWLTPSHPGLPFTLRDGC